MEAKEKLKEITLIKLVQSSKIWNSDQPVQIDCVDTQFGIFDEEEIVLPDPVTKTAVSYTHLTLPTKREV